MKKVLLTLFCLLTIVSISAVAQDDAVPTTNLTDECVTDYDPDVNYFPEQVEVTESENFSVTYGNNYKIATVTGAVETFTYVLTQCGTPLPAALTVPQGSFFLEVPIESTITLSTTQIVHLAELDVLDSLVGMDTFAFVNNADVRALIDQGDLIEVSPNFELNLELVLEAEPDAVFTDDFDSERITQLAEVDIIPAVNTDYLEATPLGQAEWIKFMALFYNEEAQATEIFSEITDAYVEAQELAASIPEDERPVVLWNAFSTFSDSWGISGPTTYAGRLIEDAGGIIAMGDEAPDGTTFLSFEAVYEGALDADIWISNLFGVNTLDDVLAIDERYADFAAFQNGEVWNNDADVNENGGSNYFELGVTNPHLILRDLVAIFHPGLLPDHELRFYRRIEN